MTQRCNAALALGLLWLSGCNDGPSSKDSLKADTGDAGGGPHAVPPDGTVSEGNDAGHEGEGDANVGSGADAGNDMGSDASAEGETDAGDVPSTPDAATPDASAEHDGGQGGVCDPIHLASIVGTYREPSGLEHWLRSTATAQLYAEVPLRPARPTARPSLRVVEAACDGGESGQFVVSVRSGERQRWDWVRQSNGLALCSTALGSESTTSLLAAAGPDPADLAKGCRGAAWNLVKEVKLP